MTAVYATGKVDLPVLRELMGQSQGLAVNCGVSGMLTIGEISTGVASPYRGPRS